MNRVTRIVVALQAEPVKVIAEVAVERNTKLA